jgi:transposase
MNPLANLNDLSPHQLRALAAELLAKVGQKDQELLRKDRELQYRQMRIDQLTHELSVLKRLQFGKRSEQLSAEQVSLFDETMDADLATIEAELEALQSDSPQRKPRQQPKRALLPPQLPRTTIHHEPDDLTCSCGCRRIRIGEDVSEKLDYTPGVFTVERHVRGKWACKACETLIQAPVPAQVIDKGIPTAALLAQVLVAKFGDHLPLYRQERIFARAGLAIPRSTLGAWVGTCGVQLQPLVEALREEILRQGVLHADETPVQMLSPGQGKTHRAYLWAYCPTQFADMRAVVYDFADSRAGEHARAFLGGWRGKLVCDNYSGYKAGFAQGMTEVGCLAHARRKFFDLHAANKSQIAQRALQFFGELYDIERDISEMGSEQRWANRQARARPIADALHAWMTGQRQLVPEGSAIAKALDYSLKRWEALTRYLDDGHLPVDNNWIENQIRPWAIGRSNWLFVGSLRAGQRAAAIMSLVRSAQLNAHDPYLYLKDVLMRLPNHPAKQIAELLPHRWKPVVATI